MRRAASFVSESAPLRAFGPLGVWALVLAGATGCPDEPLLNTTFDLCVEPGDVDFGGTTIRNPVSRTLAVENCGSTLIDGLTGRFESDADIDQATLEKVFSLVATEVPNPLRPGERFFLPVRFRPQSVGTLDATLDLILPDRETETLERINLTGVGLEPNACVLQATPTEMLFEATELSQTSAPQTLTLENTGSGSCDVAAVQIAEGHSDFAIVGDAAATLAPGDTLSVDVLFTPTSEIGPAMGLASAIVDGSTRHDVALAGDALPNERCRLALSPDPVALARASVGFSDASADAVLINDGELPCTVNAITVSALATDFTLDGQPTLPLTLEPGDSTGLSIRFTPTLAGERIGEVTFAETGGYDLKVNLLAFADPTPSCGLLFTPNPVAFPPRGVGLYEEQTVTVENASAVTCDLSTVALSADASPEFALVGTDTLGVLLPGESVSVTLGYTAIAAAPSTGTLDVGYTDGGGASADLIGFGDYAELVLTPGLQPFGIITEGCVSETFPSLLTNVGPVPARIDSITFSAASDPNFEQLTPVSAGTFLDAGESIDLGLRMAAAPAPGPTSGFFEVFSTGTFEPLVRAALYGETAPLSAADRTDVFTQRDQPAVDILFVVDNSGSMLHEQQSLSQNFSAFIQFTQGLDIDYHIGVVTTDTDVANAGELVAPYIANMGPDASVDPIGEFVAAVNVGTNGSGSEKGLEAAVLALTAPNITGPNAGFLREGALLSVIYISDENDSSPGDVGDYIDDLLAVKGYDSDAVIASAIAGEPPTGCSGGGNDASSGGRYYDTVLALEGLFESICTPDWSTTMEEIGIGTFSALTRFTLTRVPDESTIVVTIDGVPIPQDDLNGWEFNEETNAISFNGTSVPDSGAVVAVNYTAECLQP